MSDPGQGAPISFPSSSSAGGAHPEPIRSGYGPVPNGNMQVMAIRGVDIDAEIGDVEILSGATDSPNPPVLQDVQHVAGVRPLLDTLNVTMDTRFSSAGGFYTIAITLNGSTALVQIRTAP